MRKATRVVAAALGVLAGLAGLEHGIFEILQGNVTPATLAFPSMGPPCDPKVAWSGCEPALSILPNLLISGILTVLISLAVIAWSAAFVQRKNGGTALILLSLLLLLIGGGFFPPLIGLIGGIAGTRILKPFNRKPSGGLLRLAAALWAWPLVLLSVWSFGQFPVGYFFNDFLKSIMGFGLLLILTMLPLSVFSAYARDAQAAPGEPKKEAVYAV
ncbi:MAG TPA: hypothetical protein VMT46_11365 [Anaerolineaceae bacterium]|nr:hypothetical protein [Anaerolineaceae bacterium]